MYALGEILLVMIGILLALQVNNWNNLRLDRQAEKGYLSRILNDLQADLDQLAVNKTENQRFIACALDVLDEITTGSQEKYILNANFRKVIEEVRSIFHENERIQSMSFGRKLDHAGRYRDFRYAKSTIDEMVSTGQVGVINDSEIKAEILQHYDDKEYLASFQEFLIEPQTNYRNALLQNKISLFNQESVEQVKRRMTDPEFISISLEQFLSPMVSCIHVFYEHDQSIKNRTEKLMTRIQEYLNSR